MIIYIQSFIIVALEMIFCNFFFGAFCEKRNKISKRMEMLSLLLLIIIIFIGANVLGDFLKTVVCILGITLIMYHIYNVTFIKSIVFSILFQALLLVCDYLSLLLALGLLGTASEIEEKYLWQGTLIIALSKMLTFLCIVIIKKINKKMNADLLDNKEWLKFILFPLFSICIILIMLYEFCYIQDPRTEVLSFVLSIGLVGLNIVVYYLINDILRRETIIRENERFMIQAKNQTELYYSISENFDLQRRKTHEYKNQILCIDSLLEDGNYEELKKYVNGISNRLNNELDAINTNHVIANAILNTKYQETVDKGILFIIKINDLSSLIISDEDIVVILSNILNNAIEACEKCDRKIIKLKFIHEANNIILSVKNTYNGELHIREGKMVTTKKENIAQHGIGINNIVDTIKKYNGSYVIQNDTEWFFFSIIIPQKKEI